MKAILILLTCAGLAAAGSALLYAAFDVQWWVQTTPEPSFRSFLLIMLPGLAIAAGITAGAALLPQRRF